ncbi:hypothetical protein ACOSQ2_006500 [Xanthoceras sorbifolium]
MEEKWRAPSSGWFKLNCDVTVDAQHKMVGFGVIIRDENGLVMGASAQNYNSLVSVDVAKAVAELHGIQFAADIRIGPIGIESNSSSILSNFLS